MKWLTFKISRKPGFRFNVIDLTLIAVLVLLSLWIKPFFSENYYYLLPLYVGLSFFMFCNVFRIGNKLEAFWYIPFIIIVVSLFHKPEVFWWAVLLILEPLKVALVFYAKKKGSYEGI